MRPRHPSPTLRTLLRIGPEPGDWAFDVWSKAAAKNLSLDEPSVLRRLLRVARFARRRAEQRRKQREDRWAREYELAALGMRSHPADAVEHEALAGALRLLPALDAEIVLARYVLDASSAEIAEALDLPASTIRWRLARGLATLRIGLVAWSDGAEALAVPPDDAARQALMRDLGPLAEPLSRVWSGRLILVVESEPRGCRITSVRFVGPSAPPAAVARGFRRRVARVRLPPASTQGSCEVHLDVDR